MYACFGVSYIIYIYICVRARVVVENQDQVLINRKCSIYACARVVVEYQNQVLSSWKCSSKDMTRMGKSSYTLTKAISITRAIAGLTSPFYITGLPVQAQHCQ